MLRDVSGQKSPGFDESVSKEGCLRHLSGAMMPHILKTCVLYYSPREVTGESSDTSSSSLPSTMAPSSEVMWVACEHQGPYSVTMLLALPQAHAIDPTCPHRWY